MILFFIKEKADDVNMEKMKDQSLRKRFFINGKKFDTKSQANKKLFNRINQVSDIFENKRKEINNSKGKEDYLSAEELLNMGEIYSKNGQFDKALENYKKSLEKDSSNRMTWHRMGMTYTNLHEFLKAVEHLEKAV
ncbi:unnamed protein product, partial [marine sediment metagenome]